MTSKFHLAEYMHRVIKGKSFSFRTTKAKIKWEYESVEGTKKKPLLPSDSVTFKFEHLAQQK